MERNYRCECPVSEVTQRDKILKENLTARAMLLLSYCQRHNALLLLLVLAFGTLSVLPLQWLPPRIPWAQYMNMLHPIAGMALVLWLAIISRARVGWSLVTVGLISLVCAILVELAQGFLGRNPSGLDVATSTIGILAGLALLAIRAPRGAIDKG